MSKKTFFGGVHPMEQKKLTRDIPCGACAQKCPAKVISGGNVRIEAAAS